MKLEELPCHSLREKALYLREKDQQKPGPLSEGAEKAVRRWRWASRGTVATLGLKKGLAGTLLEGGACQGRKQACGAGGGVKQKPGQRDGLTHHSHPGPCKWHRGHHEDDRADALSGWSIWEPELRSHRREESRSSCRG